MLFGDGMGRRVKHSRECYLEILNESCYYVLKAFM